MTTRLRILASAAILTLMAATAAAQPITIVSQTGPDSTVYLIGPDEGSRDSATQILTASWTSANEYTDVSISARLYCNCGHFAATAFLTTNIGPDVPPVGAAVYLVAAAAFNAPLPPQQSDWVTLFTGLDLPPGTYYLTVAAPRRTVGGWTSGSPLTTVTDAGVSANSHYRAYGNAVNLTYDPVSQFEILNFNGQYLVTGNPIGDPFAEPAGVYDGY